MIFGLIQQQNLLTSQHTGKAYGKGREKCPKLTLGPGFSATLTYKKSRTDQELSLGFSFSA